MNFNRPSADDFSPVERAILRGLGVERLDFRPTRPRLLIPFGGLGVRTAEQRVHELEQLDAEKEAMAAGGLTWDPAYDERQWGISREEVHEALANMLWDAEDEPAAAAAALQFANEHPPVSSQPDEIATAHG